MSQLLSLIEAFCAREDRNVPWVAEKSGIEAKTIYSWKYRRLKKPLKPEVAFALSLVIKTPYEEVLAASLADSGYSPEAAERSFRDGFSAGRSKRQAMDAEGEAPDPDGSEFGA